MLGGLVLLAAAAAGPVTIPRLSASPKVKHESARSPVAGNPQTLKEDVRQVRGAGVEEWMRVRCGRAVGQRGSAGAGGARRGQLPQVDGQEIRGPPWCAVCPRGLGERGWIIMVMPEPAALFLSQLGSPLLGAALRWQWSNILDDWKGRGAPAERSRAAQLWTWRAGGWGRAGGWVRMGTERGV